MHALKNFGQTHLFLAIDILVTSLERRHDVGYIDIEYRACDFATFAFLMLDSHDG
jgi:hypothetical protein